MLFVSRKNVHCVPSTTRIPLDVLPLELQLEVISNLTYPDALALKHTNNHFYALIPPTIISKVTWLIARHERGLPGPTSKCIMKTDGAFCLGAGGEVKEIMRRRRRHQDCKAGVRGCEVIAGRTCTGPQFTAQEKVRGYRLQIEAWTGKFTYWAFSALVLSICVNIILLVTRNEGSFHECITAAFVNIWISN